MQSELERNQPFASVVVRVSKFDVYEVPVRFALIAGARADRSAVHERRARGVFTEIRGSGRPDSPTIQSLLNRQWTNRKGDTQQTGIRDILVVSSYNIHTNFLGRACPRGLRLAPSINSRARKPTLS